MKKAVIIFLVLLIIPSSLALGADWYLGSIQGMPYSMLSVTNEINFLGFLGARASVSHIFCTTFSFGIDVKGFIPLEEGVRIYGLLGEVNIWDLENKILHPYIDFGLGVEFQIPNDWKLEYEIGPAIILRENPNAPSVMAVSQFIVRKKLRTF